MSNIYIQEPPTNGKVLLRTTAGEIDIELWSKEAPKACRNFIQLCMEEYYNNTIFHRVVPGFIVQGGDPTGTGSGGESVYGAPFKDEFHSRLRFNRRGLVAMANAGPHDNGSQFFFTLGRADELNNKHTIFGKVTGDTIYNMLRLAEVEVDKEERPLSPHKIRSCEVLFNPFDDIVPRPNRKLKKEKPEEETNKKSKVKGTKNFNLLSFGEEAEEEEEEVSRVSQDEEEHDEDADSVEDEAASNERFQIKERIAKKLKIDTNENTKQQLQEEEAKTEKKTTSRSSNPVVSEPHVERSAGESLVYCEALLEMFQFCDHFHGSLLDLLQEVLCCDPRADAAVQREEYLSCGPKLNTGFEVWPHQCPAQGDNPCPAPAGHTIADPGQDAIALLGPWAHPGSRSVTVTSTPRSFPATLPQSVELPGAVVTQGQDPALGLVEPHTIGLSP
ncbi:hypothetical protein DUI87_18922 [Hirundo rustica rustica]|uniref:Spliceosome-associated protein CWC27 homolog n=1 Tax=Hirundo rustica rustica TaxID=333673 RepID=A0A3M0KBC3_HIRRU|nr:hypothetical protein DUI87_18922 [Hirundo rustica rustica]